MPVEKKIHKQQLIILVLKLNKLNTFCCQYLMITNYFHKIKLMEW